MTCSKPDLVDERNFVDAMISDSTRSLGSSMFIAFAKRVELR